MKSESPTGLILGERGRIFFESLEIDQGAFFTTLPIEDLRRIGAPSHSMKVVIDLEDGRKVESSVYSIRLNVGGRTGNSLAVAFEGARSVLGSKFLEDLGLRISRESGLLEPSREPHVPSQCEE